MIPCGPCQIHLRQPPHRRKSLKSSAKSLATWDTGQEEASGWRTFRVVTIRWQRLTWVVAAQNAEEAERRFESGLADGPVAVEEDGQHVVEVTRMR